MPDSIQIVYGIHPPEAEYLEGVGIIDSLKELGLCPERVTIYFEEEYRDGLSVEENRPFLEKRFSDLAEKYPMGRIIDLHAFHNYDISPFRPHPYPHPHIGICGDKTRGIIKKTPPRYWSPNLNFRAPRDQSPSERYTVIEYPSHMLLAMAQEYDVMFVDSVNGENRLDYLDDLDPGINWAMKDYISWLNRELMDILKGLPLINSHGQ